MVKFAEFCRRIVTDVPLSHVSDSMDIPDRYKTAVKALIKDLKPKKNIFNKINVLYVEPIFDGSYNIDIASELDEKLDDGEIPDGIINALSEGIFGNKPSVLTDKQQAIIKVLAVYICIQN